MLDALLNNRKIKKKLPLILLIVGAVFILGGILIMIFAAGNTDGIVKAICIIMPIVMILFGLASLYFITLITGKDEPNFFLYETSSDANMPIEALTFEHANKKMTYFMTRIAPNAVAVWQSDIIGSDNEWFGEENEFRPLAAYKALYDLADRGNEVMWNAFLKADSSVIESIAKALHMNQDSKLADTFMELHARADGNYAKTQKFLQDNKGYLEKKIMKYIYANIDKF